MKLSYLSIALACFALNLNARISYDPYYFGTDERAKRLETMTLGKWWTKQPPPKSRKNSKFDPAFILDRPRDKIMAFALYTHDRGVLKLSAQTFPLMPKEPQSITLEFKKNGKWFS